ncbi:MAG: hypothetical protein ACI4IH_01290 [Eubacterium sp.]
MFKSKSFSKKLLSLLLAALMALSCFTGALSAYAAGMSADSEYTDNYLSSNFLGWVETTDEQTLTALLDWVDGILADNCSTIKGSLNVYVSTIDYDLTSINGALSTVNSARQLLNNNTVKLILGGDAKNINLGGCLKGYANTGGGSEVMTRENSTSKDIIRGIANIIYMNTNDSAKSKNNSTGVKAGGTVIQQFINGTFTMGSTLNGIVSKAIGGSIYEVLGNALGMPAGYEKNLANNIVAYMLKSKVADDLQKDNVNNNLDTSTSTYYFKDSNGNALSFEQWAADAINNGVLYTLIGLDEYYMFSNDSSHEDYFSLDLSKTAYEQFYDAFQPIYKHTLVPLIGTISVAHSFVTDFTKMYYNYVTADKAWVAPITQSQIDSYWTTEKLDAWIAADINTIASYLDGIKETVDGVETQRFPGLGTRDAITDQFTATCTADDVKAIMQQLFTELNEGRNETEIDPVNLFNKVLYSPIAATWGIQTGVLNLNIKDTYFGGFKNIYDFSVIPENGSVANNVYGLVKSILSYLFPTFNNWAPASATQDVDGIVTEFVQSALNLIKFVADSSSTAILADFYAANGADAVLTESNIESAILPLIKMLLNQIGMAKQIHQETWDKCDDVDGIIYVCLEEYLKYVLPDNDYSFLAPVGADGYIDTDITKYQYMARDAVAYVMQNLVPLMEADGSQWNVFVQGGTTNGALNDSSTTLYDMLNKVVCYYADNMQIAQLLGLTNYGCSTAEASSDPYGSAINLSHTLWENIDIIVNKAFPAIPSLLKDGEGNVKSEDLIMKTIVNGIVNIADVNTTQYGRNKQGVSAIFSNIVYLFIQSAPVTSKAMINVVYDFLQDIFNTIIGPRDSGDPWGLLIPNNTGYRPFTDLVQNGTLSSGSVAPSSACTGYYTNGGILAVLFARIAENGRAGVLYTGTSRSTTDTVLPGIAYLIKAVNSFIPSFVPQLAQHSYSAPEASFTTPYINAFNIGTQQLTGMTYLAISNESLGLNRNYIENGQVKQLSRYFVDVKSIACDDSKMNISLTDVYKKNSDGTFGSTTSAPIQGGKTLYFGVNGSVSSAGVKTVTVTYDVVDVNGNVITDANGNALASFRNQTAKAYLYVTNEADWFGTTYTRTGNGLSWFDTAYEVPSGSFSTSAVTYNYKVAGLENVPATKTTGAFGASSQLSVLYPAKIILDSNDAGTFDKVTMRADCKSWNKGGVYTMFAYVNNPDGSTPENNAVVPVNQNGDIIDYRTLDYYYAHNDTWISAANGGANGIDEDGDGNVDYGYSDTRPHVIASYADIQAGTATGVANYKQYADKDGNLLYATISYTKANRDTFCWGTPIPGIYLNFNDGSGQIEFSVKTSMQTQYFRWIKTFNTDELATGDYTLNVAFDNQNSNAGERGHATLDISIRDTQEKANLEGSYDQLKNFVATYQPSDFTDYNGSSSATYNTVVEQLKNTIVTLGEPVSIKNVNNNVAFLSNRQDYAKTSTSGSTFGDKAYVQADSQNTPNWPVSDNMKKYGSNTNEWGETSDTVTYYYADKLCTIPYYTNTQVAVTAQNFNTDRYVYLNSENKIVTTYEAGVTAYVKNAPDYEKAWDATTYQAPYYGDTAELSGMYDQVQFVYRRADGSKTSSKDINWAFKVAEQVNQIIPNTGSTENRGIYMLQADRSTYTMQEAKKLVNSSAASRIITDVSEDRANLNENNFDKVTYQLMVNAAKLAEGLVSTSYDTEFIYVTTDSEEYEVRSTYEFYLTADDPETATPFDTTTYPLFYSKLLAGEYASIGLTASSTEDEYKFGYTSPVKNAKGEIDYTYSTTASGATIDEAIRLYEFYKSKVVHRGYVDNDGALMREIICATGDTYNYNYDQAALKSHINSSFSATVGEYDPTTNELVSGETKVVFTDTSIAPKYGTLAADGTLQNVNAEGNQAYTTDSWDWYVRFLATAINTVATAEGQTGYTQGIYDNTQTYNIEVSDNDSTRTTLMKAENTLVPYVAETPAGYTVTAYVGAMAKPTDKVGKYAVTGATVSITTADDTVISATTDNSGMFVLENVPNGTYTATVTYSCGFERTFTIIVNGADVSSTTMVGIVACNWDGNNTINVADKNKFTAANGSSSADETYNVQIDIDRNGNINVADKSIYSAFNGYDSSAVSYGDITIQ